MHGRPGHFPIRLTALACLAAFAFAPAAGAQVENTAETETARRLLGALRETWISVEADRAPVRAVVEAIETAAGVPIQGRWRREGHPLAALGLDPSTPVSLRVKNQPALLVLERVLAEASEFEPATWQLRKGYVEVGTKSHLGLDGARETRAYALDDLLLEPPYFAAGGATDPGAARRHTHHPAALSDRFAPRKGPEELAAEMIEGLVETIEPRNWDDPRYDEIPVDLRPERLARVRLLNGTLLIRAPGFIHRAVGGPPPAVSPVPPDPRALQERGRAASGEDLRVEVVAVGSDAGLPGPEEVVRRLQGVIESAPVTLALESVPALDAIDRLASHLDVEIVPRVLDATHPYGIDPGRTVSVDAHGMPAHRVLEEILAQTAPDPERATWQIREGYVELGDTARLARPSAAVRRVYDIADLIMQIPDAGEARKHRDALGLDLVEEIVETIEPGMWDWGQFDDEPIVPDDAPSIPAKEAAPERDEPSGRTPLSGRGGADPPARYVPPRKPAIIRYWQGAIIVVAPDFIHRRLAGYPDAIAPRPR